MNLRISRYLLLALLLAVAFPARAQSLKEVFERVNSSVVVIKVMGKAVNPLRPGQLTTASGLGSGVLISNDGKVMTAAHVVQTADEITVEFLDGEVIDAKVISSDPTGDVALLKLRNPPSKAQPVQVGDSDQVSVGDPIFVIGAPYGIDHTLTAGLISGRRIPKILLKGMSPVEFFQTDAAVNQGNSGGPMFNMDGEVIGIVSYIITKSGGFEGLGFAATSNMARRLLLESTAFWSGMDGLLLTGDLAKIFNVPQWGGFLVQSVAENSPSEKIGIKGGTIPIKIQDEILIVGGDIVLEVMGVPLDEEGSLAKIREIMNKLSPAQIIKVKILRGGKTLELSSAWVP